MTERPDERVEAIRREYQHLSGFGFQSKAVADVVAAYDAERARAERAEARARRWEAALVSVERRAELALFNRADMAALDEALWEIRQTTKTALATDEGADDE